MKTTPKGLAKLFDALNLSTRVREVTEYYLLTGKPMKVPGMTCNPEYYPEELTPVGGWSQYAEPSQGWEPTKELLKDLLCVQFKLPRVVS